MVWHIDVKMILYQYFEHRQVSFAGGDCYWRVAHFVSRVKVKRISVVLDEVLGLFNVSLVDVFE
tara:strand:+ start:185 stop:376 length:192 start_codon:yes stop_codon:yes gene_type:complete